MVISDFCALPEELIVHILAELDLQDLLSCSQTCRLLHVTIKHATILRYHLQLFISGMQDCGPASRLPIVERLTEVEVQQEGWTNLRFRARHMFPVPQYCRVWELYGGVIAHGVPKGFTTRGLAFIRFPSITRGVPGHVWEHADLGVNIRDFAFDPTQDLMVIIAATPRGLTASETSDREIHLFAMSSGTKHPLAAASPLTCSLNRATDKDSDFVMQIMTDFVAILFHAREVDCKDQLFIWHWKKGELVIDYMFVEMNKMDAFTFLSSHHFLVSMIEPTRFATEPPELQVYEFVDTDPLSPTTPRLVRGFQLPQPVEGAITAAMTIRADPAPGDASAHFHLEGAPFRTGPLSHLLVISIVILHPVTGGHFARKSFQLFVNSSTLLDHHPREKSERIIPWEAWGPACSRMLNDVFLEFTWVCYVHGTRYVTLDRRGPELRKSRLRMLDFNPLLIKRTQYAQGLDSGWTSDGDTRSEAPRTHECRIVSASEPTVIPGGQGFENDVETRLPYRDICSAELVDYRAVMIDEECLVGIHGPLVDGRRVIEVLCF